MSFFRYRAKDRWGNTIQGSLTASTREQALSQLWEQGYYILKVKEYRGKEKSLGGWRMRSLVTRGKVSSRDLMFFCGQFGTLLSAGMTALHSLQTLQRKADNPTLGKALGEVTVRLEQGHTLWECFARQPQVFPPVLIHMVEAGETGGVLPEVLERLSYHFEQEYELKEKIKTATAYPLLIMALAVLVISFLVTQVLPVFSGLFAGTGVELPLLTRIVLGLGESASRYGPYILFATAAGLLFFLRYIKTETGRNFFHRVLFKIPLYGSLYRKVLTARFSRVMATLLASGVGVLLSLELVEKVVNNNYFAGVLERVREGVVRGEKMSPCLEESSFFPSMVVEMISVGEDTGQLNLMLEKAAHFLESEVQYTAGRLTSILEPVLIIFMSAVVGTIALSVLLPMFDMFQHIG